MFVCVCVRERERERVHHNCHSEKARKVNKLRLFIASFSSSENGFAFLLKITLKGNFVTKLFSLFLR